MTKNSGFHVSAGSPLDTFSLALSVCAFFFSVFSFFSFSAPVFRYLLVPVVGHLCLSPERNRDFIFGVEEKQILSLSLSAAKWLYEKNVRLLLISLAKFFFSSGLLLRIFRMRCSLPPSLIFLLVVIWLSGADEPCPTIYSCESNLVVMPKKKESSF